MYRLASIYKKDHMKCYCILATVSEIINVIRVLSPLSHILLTVPVPAEMLIHLEDR